MTYKVTYSTIAWKNMTAFIQAKSESDMLGILKDRYNGSDSIKVIDIEELPDNANK